MMNNQESNVQLVVLGKKKKRKVWPWIVLGLSVGMFTVAMGTILSREEEALPDDDPRADQIRDLIAEAERLLETQNKLDLS